MFARVVGAAIYGRQSAKWRHDEGMREWTRVVFIIRANKIGEIVLGLQNNAAGRFNVS